MKVSSVEPVGIGPLLPETVGIAAHAARARKLFGNQGLHEAAEAFAVAHDRAIQYLEQAPVLVMGVRAGGVGVRRTNRLYVQHKLVPLCERGAQLKEVMRTFGLPAPLRALKPYALSPGVEHVIFALSSVDPAVLGRVLPAKASLQRRWLHGLLSWHATMARRGPHSLHLFSWAAERLAQAAVQPREVSTVADLCAAAAHANAGAEARFNPAWGWPRAVEEASAWHARISIDAQLAGTPFRRDTQIDFGSHPDQVEMDGLTFSALRTPIALAEEGAAMRHCVASYIRDVISGRCSIVALRRGAERVATMELVERQIVQLKGKCNEAVSDTTWSAARAYVADLPKPVARKGKL